MRDVTPTSSSMIAEVISYLKKFALNPLKEIRNIPNWNWPRILTLQVVLSLASGILSAFVTTDFSTWKLAQGIFFFPLIATIIGFALASFFYYYFQVFEKKTVAFNRLAILVFLSMTVFYLLHTLSGILSLFDILGMAFTGALLIVGLTENFHLAKRRSLRMVGILFFLIFLVWVFEKLRVANLVRSVDSGQIDQSL